MTPQPHPSPTPWASEVCLPCSPDPVLPLGVSCPQVELHLPAVSPSLSLPSILALGTHIASRSLELSLVSLALNCLKQLGWTMTSDKSLPS